MSGKHLFIGIDLGTTNSSIHWGALNPTTNRVEPRSLAYDQQTSDGTIERRALLPSFLWFRQGESGPVVGEFARARGLEAQPSRVARAVKNYMGRADWRFKVDGKDYTAAELSGILLKTMLVGMKKTWGEEVSDVVITVPASFDSDMRTATLEAAELAGFKVSEKDDTPRNLLLDEPRAALYDFLNQQLCRHLPPNVRLDLTTPKIVLVYDLGGGTLDVSLHRVRQSEDVDEIGVDDLAISRYTQLGGGVFDNLIADEFQDRFESRHKMRLTDLSPQDRHQVRIKLEVQAEQAKQRLTNDIDQRLNQGVEEIAGDFSVDIQVPFLHDNKSFITQLTKKEFEDIIAPLLATKVKLADAARPVLTGDTDNIVYPIIDVLHKANLKLGNIPKVDAILLNGGMTRVHAIRERLVNLFGFQPITVLDPEHAVSRGAAIYHYLLHRGWRPREILAESIGIEVEGAEIFNLVPAGTVLPLKRRFKDKFSIPHHQATRLNIPLFRGEGLTPALPNKKILERQFAFAHPQPEGTPIDVEIGIDESKVIQFTATLPNGERAEVIVGVDENETKRATDTALVGERTPWTPPPLDPPIDPRSFQEKFKDLSSSWDERGLKELGNQALKAGNASQLVGGLLRSVRHVSRPGKQRIMWIFGEYGMRYPDQSVVPELIESCIQTLRWSLGYDKAVATVGRNAAVALGKIGSQAAESYLVNVLGKGKVAPIRFDILIALGKCGATYNAIEHVRKYMNSERDGERINSLWALGRMVSREREPRVPIERLEELVSIIGQRVFPQYETHVIARKHAVYALGEIGDRRSSLGHQDILDGGHATYILQVLEKSRDQMSKRASQFPQESELYQMFKLIQIAQKQVRGENLTPDESRVLMSVRTLMAVEGD